MGRFEMTIPYDATAVYGPAEVELPLWTYAGEARNIDSHIKEHLNRVEASRSFLSEDDISELPMFGKITDGKFPGQKIVFGSKNQSGYSMHSFFSVGENLFIQDTSNVHRNDDEVGRMVNIFNDVATHLRMRADTDTPEEDGICIDGGFVALKPKYERVTIGVRLKEFPDVHLSVDVHKNLDYLVESSGLQELLRRTEERAQREGMGAFRAGIKWFRKQPRQLGIWDGYEALARLPAYKKNPSIHEFRFHSVGAVNDWYHPELDVRLNTGVQNNLQSSINPSISDDEALALWDKLISSIRLRKTTSVGPSAGGSKMQTLGALSASGDVCPQSGWWRCAESEVEQGARRHFCQGEEFPPVVLLGEPTLWQRAKGERPSLQRNTVWQLVAYDEMPPAMDCQSSIGAAADPD